MNQRWVAFFRIAVGIFFLTQGLNKLEWLNSSEMLKTNLDRYAINAQPVTLWYHHYVARPGVEAWSRLIPTGEILIGVSLLLGLLTRSSLIAALLLVVNFQLANGKIFSMEFFSDPHAFLLLASLVLLFVSKSNSVLALDASSKKKKAKK
jgi:uncharacterized membrane protein YphA (DoxX/SURF4 family)